MLLEKSDNDPSSPAFSQIQKMFLDGPVFVKPADQGSAIGVNRVEKFVDLKPALAACFKVSDRALIEHFVSGRELTVGILGDRALPVVEIVPQHDFYDFHSKYAKGGSKHLVPADISPVQTVQAQKVAMQAFRSLGCEVYGRVDIILEPGDKFAVLEVNTIPGMTDTSLLPDAAKAEGITFDELVLQIVELSLQRHATKI
jgi:D-alanine-D-alanine ligase